MTITQPAKPIAIACGMAALASGGWAHTTPVFATSDLGTGYQLVSAGGEAVDSGTTENMEGEANAAGEQKDAEGKCGEGKCGGGKKQTTTKTEEEVDDQHKAAEGK